MGLKSASTVVSALSARSVVGLKSASTIVYALRARSVVGAQSASTVVGALTARSAVGLKSASTVVSALTARSAAGLESASTAVSALIARSAAGLQSASTVVSALSARTVEANGCNQTSSHDYHIYHQNVPRGVEGEKLLELVRSLINDNRGDALRVASSLTSNSIHHRTHLSARRVSPNNP